jgi:transcriptional regulator with XRE-family HTH domain
MCNFAHLGCKVVKSRLKEQIGTQIRQERKRRGFNQAQLAERLGVDIGTVSRWETGKNAPTGAQLAALKDAFGVSGDFFEEGPTEAPIETEALLETIRRQQAEIRELRLRPAAPPGPTLPGFEERLQRLSALRLTETQRLQLASTLDAILQAAEGRAWRAADSGLDSTPPAPRDRPKKRSPS